VSKRKIGNLAVSILDDLINAADKQPAVKVLVGADLVVRQSDSVLSSRKRKRQQLEAAGE
jgi:LacI family transcriptional regulator